MSTNSFHYQYQENHKFSLLWHITVLSQCKYLIENLYDCECAYEHIEEKSQLEYKYTKNRKNNNEDTIEFWSLEHS